MVYSYSFSMMAFHVVIMWLIAFGLKRPRIALVLLLGHLLGGDLLFYYPVSEYQMGLSMSLLWYALLPEEDFRTYTWKKYLVFFLTLVTAIYAHPLSLLFIGFLIAYNFVEQKSWRNWRLFLTVSGLAIAIFISKYLLFSIYNDPDNAGILANLKFFSLHAFKILWGQWITYHYLFLALSVFTLIYLWAKKKYTLSAFLILAFYGCLYAFLSKQGAEPYHWYGAHIYQSLYYLPIFVLCLQIPEKWWNKLWLFISVSLITIVAVIQVVSRSNFNQERMMVISDYLEAARAQGVQKAIIDHSDPNNRREYWFWALEYESLVISLFNFDETRTVIYKFKGDYCSTCPQVTEEFLTVWGAFSLDEFNADYVDFDDSPYRVIETSESTSK